MGYDVTPTMIANRWRALTPSEQDIATLLIADATDLLDVKRPALAGLAVAGTRVFRIAQQIIMDAVQRVLRNPDVMDAQQIGADGSLGFQFVTPNEAKVGQSRLRMDIADQDLVPLDEALYGPQNLPGRGGMYVVVLQDPDPVY